MDRWYWKEDVVILAISIGVFKLFDIQFKYWITYAFSVLVFSILNDKFDIFGLWKNEDDAE